MPGPISDLAADVQAYAVDAFDTLTDRCVPTAACFLQLLREAGRQGKLAGGYYVDLCGCRSIHTWVVLEDEQLIVDPTRGQFDDGALVTGVSDPQYDWFGFSLEDDMLQLMRFWAWKEHRQTEVARFTAACGITLVYPPATRVPDVAPVMAG